MKNSSSALASILEKFFTERLMNQKRVSNETVMAYRDTFRLLLKYAQSELGKKPSKLLLEDLLPLTHLRSQSCWASPQNNSLRS